MRGRIVDENGQGFPGVNVLIKGTTIGTVTDAVGYYSIPLTSDAQILVCSFVGYQSQEVSIGNQNEINIQLSPAATEFAEIVVRGYGATKEKKSLTYSTTTVQEDG